MSRDHLVKVTYNSDQIERNSAYAYIYTDVQKSLHIALLFIIDWVKFLQASFDA